MDIMIRSLTYYNHITNVDIELPGWPVRPEITLVNLIRIMPA